MLNAQQPQTFKFVERDTQSLYLDLYHPDAGIDNGYCVLFVFGGGFIEGKRDGETATTYAAALLQKGYSVICIDYRLGLVGAKMKGVAKIKSTERAIKMAVEDLFAATHYILQNAESLHINTDKIVLSGSSAGAITVLQGDYELGNRSALAEILPEDFHYAGVMAFAGAIFSREGKIQYRAHAPAPTMFLQGIEDRLVTYEKIQFANIGWFGTNAIVPRFEKFNYPYYVRRYEGLGHEVAGFMTREIELSDWFIKTYIVQKRFLQIDQTYNDPAIPRSDFGSFKPSDLYN